MSNDEPTPPLTREQFLAAVRDHLQRPPARGQSACDWPLPPKLYAEFKRKGLI